MATTIEEVLLAPEAYRQRGWLFLASGTKWSLASEALVLPLDDVFPDEELEPGAGIPAVVKERQFSLVLQIADVEGIVSNARAQRANIGVAELLEALIYYVDHDAYKDFRVR